ncbi:response regulator with CheY-like receiver, AAA-type ATPase, and DNA-binding domains [Herbaspirillum sp. CF444]|uniref:sigma 54-interacting transcriptional regulator n=1 Tax=Herbaspirillum sp. CF444 TaxID=1144319 RepID=UPI0002726865|nr:sigma-54 dependent transcriptional regulator [Herbaspirillum sp. CF444]EJL94069.1 response regulator with CheY-like receiver, AAA-type ATPase, and DNA-binding domains [Herbaspirillum sp. CF444]
MSELLKKKLIGSSVRFQQTCTEIMKIAAVDATVMVCGETGTGKELAARAIHYQSTRKNKPFIPVNCGALPEALIESELFGHERGAFTDAKAASVGLVCEADGGTLFLDEVDALSPRAQSAMLRFLQDKSYRRLGSGTERHADVRIIVATNSNLEQLVQERRFRQDLLYRLNVLLLRMPPLREREGDGVELARAFLAKLSRQYQMPEKALHAEAITFIGSHRWPGNIRELENAIHREFLMTEGNEVRLGAASSDTQQAAENLLFKDAKAHAIAEFERRYLGNVLQKAAGNLSLAARLAGQERSAFGKLARKHNIKGTDDALPLSVQYSVSQEGGESNHPSRIYTVKK